MKRIPEKQLTELIDLLVLLGNKIQLLPVNLKPKEVDDALYNFVDELDLIISVLKEKLK